MTEKPNYTTRIVFVTPDMAHEFLQINYDNNRPLKKRRIAMYKRDIENGNWNPYSSAPLIFDVNGKMIDGQHRCIAISQSKNGIWCEIREGVPTETYELIDSGCARKASDALGGKNKTAMEALGRAGAFISRGGSVLESVLGNETADTTKSDIIEYVNTHPLVEEAAYLYNKVRKILGKGSVYGIGLPILIMLKDNRDVVEYFIEDIEQPVPSDNRVSAYKQFCQTSIIKDTFDVKRQFALTMRCLEAIRDDEQELKKFSVYDRVIRRWNENAKNYL